MLRLLQGAVRADREVRFHLVGHSFGCIVASACVAGTPGTKSLEPVHSMLLVQGAKSLWSYSSTIPAVRNRTGYFHRLLLDEMVAGPVITTRSVHDRAVGFFYPLGASASRALSPNTGASALSARRDRALSRRTCRSVPFPPIMGSVLIRCSTSTRPP